MDVAPTATRISPTEWSKETSSSVPSTTGVLISPMAPRNASRSVWASRPARRANTTGKSFSILRRSLEAELLRKLTTLGEKNGVVLNLHNHTYEVENNLEFTPDLLEDYSMAVREQAIPARYFIQEYQLAGGREAGHHQNGH